MNANCRITMLTASALLYSMLLQAEDVSGNAARLQSAAPDPWKDAIVLAQQLQDDHKPAAARVILLATLDVAARHEERSYRLAYTLNNLGSVSQDEGQFVQAEMYYRRAIRQWLEGGEQLRGGLARTLNNLASLLDSAGKSGEAEDLLRRSEAIHIERGDSEHGETGVVLLNHATTYMKQRKFAEAEDAYRRAWRILEPYRTSRELELAQVAAGLGLVFHLTRRNEAAQAHYTFARTVWERHVRLAQAAPEVFLNLAGLHSGLGQYVQAKEVLQQGLIAARQQLGSDHPRTADMLLMYSKALRQTGDKDAAARAEKQAKAVRTHAQDRLARHTVSVSDLVREAALRR